MLKSDPPQSAPPAEPVVEAIAQALPDRGAALPGALRRWAMRLVPVLLLVAAAVVLWREFHTLSLTAVLGRMADWGLAAIAAALALVVLSFILMGAVEWLGLRWAGAKLPWIPAMAGSFLANAIAHSIGANLLVSGAVRARMYDRYGVTMTQVAATTLFSGMSFAAGISALGGAGMLMATPADLAASNIPLNAARGLGALLLCAPAAYILVCTLRRAPLRAFGRSLELPSTKDALAQLVIGVVDNATAAAIIWILLPPHTVSYAAFVGAYAVAAVAGLVSTVPGGAGVFESTIATLLHHAAAAPLAAAFLGYRLSYYLLPLVVASAALAGDAFRPSRRH